MDGWRSTNHWEGGWMVRRSPVRLDFRWVAAPGLEVHSLFFEDVFTEAFFSIFCDVGSILGRFGRSKWRPKSISGMVFYDIFFECFLACILHRFLEARNVKNRAPA